MSCNANLVKWKKKDIALCNVCNELETIQHLLHDCIFANKLWLDFNTILDFNVELKHIVLGIDTNDEMSFMISLIAYLIY